MGRLTPYAPCSELEVVPERDCAACSVAYCTPPATISPSEVCNVRPDVPVRGTREPADDEEDEEDEEEELLNEVFIAAAAAAAETGAELNLTEVSCLRLLGPVWITAASFVASALSCVEGTDVEFVSGVCLSAREVTVNDAFIGGAWAMTEDDITAPLCAIFVSVEISSILSWWLTLGILLSSPPSRDMSPFISTRRSSILPNAEGREKNTSVEFEDREGSKQSKFF